MRRLLLASVVLGLTGTISTANADIITLTSIELWNQATPGGTETDAIQQANPAAIPFFTAGPLANVTGLDIMGQINLNLPLPSMGGPPEGGTSIIEAFLATDPAINTALTTGAPVPCGTTCQNTPLSTLNFAQVTLFKFTFTVPSSEFAENVFTGTSDDGESSISR